MSKEFDVAFENQFHAEIKHIVFVVQIVILKNVLFQN